VRGRRAHAGTAYLVASSGHTGGEKVGSPTTERECQRGGAKAGARVHAPW
jgi:hypothetical protein